MSWFHRHNWKIMKSTYAPPLGRCQEFECGAQTALYILMGRTDVLLQCDCSAVRIETMVGKEGAVQ